MNNSSFKLIIRNNGIKCGYSDRLQWFNDMCARFKTGVILTWVGTKPVVVVNLPKYMEVMNNLKNKIPRYRLLPLIVNHSKRIYGNILKRAIIFNVQFVRRWSFQAAA